MLLFETGDLKKPRNGFYAIYAKEDTEGESGSGWLSTAHVNEEQITLHRPMSSSCCGHMISCIRHHGSSENCRALGQLCCVISVLQLLDVLEVQKLSTSYLIGKRSGVRWVWFRALAFITRNFPIYLSNVVNVIVWSVLYFDSAFAQWSANNIKWKNVHLSLLFS